MGLKRDEIPSPQTTATAVFEKIEPALDQFHFVIDRCERLAFALVTAEASLSFEHKSEGEEHTEDLFRA